MELNWHEYYRLEQGALLPPDESLSVMLRERRLAEGGHDGTA